MTSVQNVRSDEFTIVVALYISRCNLQRVIISIFNPGQTGIWFSASLVFPFLPVMTLKFFQFYDFELGYIRCRNLFVLVVIGLFTKFTVLSSSMRINKSSIIFVEKWDLLNDHFQKNLET